VIDGTGKYLMPGMWDMHVRLGSDEAVRQHFLRQPITGLRDTRLPSLSLAEPDLVHYLRQGITGVRDMGSPLERTAALRKEVSSGRRPGPRIITSGPMLDGAPGTMTPPVVRVAATPAEARQGVDDLDTLRVDHLSVGSHLSRDAYLSLIERARQYRRLVVGPLPATVSVREAVEERHKSVEHLSGVASDCAAGRERLRVDERRCGELMQTLARYSAYQTPTLGKLRMDLDEAGFGHAQLLVRRMAAASVPVLAGSGGVNDLAGELAQLVSAGLTPAQALRAATLTPAEYLNQTDRLGTVAPGRWADLVLLSANPLEDIKNVRHVAGVSVAGRFFTRRELDELAPRQ
jgi:imidazolonepropionase-like amidohydrolase